MCPTRASSRDPVRMITSGTLNTLPKPIYKKNLSGKTGFLYPKSTISSRFSPIAALTLRSSFCMWSSIGWSWLGLGAASAAAQYVVTHPQSSQNPVNLDFLLDPLPKSEFLSFLNSCVWYPFCSSVLIMFMSRIIIDLS